jgi:hypothetical protein
MRHGLGTFDRKHRFAQGESQLAALSSTIGICEAKPWNLIEGRDLPE